jgi:hypothetical protein
LNLLRPAVLEKLDLSGVEIGNRPTGSIRHDEINDYELGPDAERRRFLRLEDVRGEQRD